MAVCHYHGDRSGIGVCMRCRVVICSECCTRLDGVNHCHACLKALGRRPERRTASRIPAALGSLVVLGLGWLFFVAILWMVQGRLAP